MNKHLYRIVFNRALGVLQAVAEVAKGAGGGGVAAGGRATAALRPISFALWCALGCVGVVTPSLAQQVQGENRGRIVSDPNAPGEHRPTVIEAPNGVPVVNITTPSKAGVSRNVYSQFDVGEQGAILNNSRTQVQTQLGGWVQGNPWLATGTARVILNEINSANPSYLNGYVEIGGDRAQVVIANPAGLQIDGGGFLNASRVTLTTGTPILDNGALTGYHVERGTIGLSGRGLDATQTDYTDLIARSMQLNAGVWAQQLQVTAGASTVNADHTQVAAAAATGSGPAPTFALDVGALGGMYANKIWLLGTEAGLGVRNAGEIGAQAGELVVTVDGRLENTGALQSKTDTELNVSGGLANAGTISAARELTIATPQDVDNRGGTLNAQRIDVDADTLRNRDGAIEQTGAQALALQAGTLTNRDGGRIGLAAAGTGDGGAGGQNPDGGSGNNGDSGGDTGSPGGDGNEGGTDGGTPSLPEVLADGVLRIAGTLDNDGGVINAGGGVELNTANGLDNSGGHLGLRELTLTQGDLGNAGGELNVSGDAQLTVDRITNDGGALAVGGALNLETQTLSNRDGTLSQGGTATSTFTVTGTLDNTGGTLASNAAAWAIDSGVLVNEHGLIEHAGPQGLILRADTLSGQAGQIATAGAVQVTAGQVDHRGATLGATQVTVDADTFDNRGGEIVASGTSTNTFDVRTRLDNGDGGRIASRGDLQLRTAHLGNAGGTLQHAGDGTLAIDATTLAGAGGTITSNGTLTMAGRHTDLQGGTTQAERIAIDTDDLITADGTLIASGDEALQLQVTDTLDNDRGTIATNGALDLTAGAVFNRDGTVQAAGADPSRVQVAGTFDNTGGILATAGNTIITASDLLNTGGTLQAAGESSLAMTVEGLLDNSDDGLIAAGGDMQVSADTLDNTAGSIQHAGAGTLAIEATTLDGAGGTIVGNGTLAITGETTDLRGGTTGARSIVIDTGDLTTADGELIASGDEALQLQVTGTLDNDRGTIATNGALDLAAGTVFNRDGTVQAAGTDPTRVQVTHTFDNAGGTLIAAGDTTLTAADLLNTSGTVQAAGESALRITVDGRLDNSEDGLIAAGGDMTVSADTLDNTAGTLQHAGDGTLAIDATTLDGENGTILGNGALAITGQTTNLRGGTTGAQSIAIDTGDLTTADGELIATGEGPLQLQVRGTLDNDRGTVATNGALDLAAGAVLNRDGTLQAAGADPTRVQVAGTFDNTGGALAAGDTTITASDLLNTGGTVQAAGESSLAVTVEGLLDNSEAGLIAAGGDMQVVADTLDNTAGRLQHAGDGTLTIDATTLDGVNGTIAGNGTLAITGETTNLRGGTTGAQSIAITTGELTTADGTLIAAGEGPLQLRVRGTLDNDRGTVATNGALDLDAGAVLNRDGTLQAAGRDPTRVQVANTFDNTGGTLVAAGDTTVTAADLLNMGGTVQVAGESTLAMTVDGRLDNSADGLIVAGGDMALSADTLDNTAGRIQHAGEGTLAIDAMTLDGEGGTIVGNGALAITGETTHLRAGTTSAQSITIATGDLTTADGVLVSSGEGPLQLQVRGTLDNDRGTVAANGALDLDAGTVSNRDGVLQAAGSDPTRMQVAGTFDNTGGTLAAAGDTAITAADLINTGGTVQVAGASALQIAVDGRLDNSEAGLIAAGSDMQVVADTLDNTAGRLQHAGDGTLAIDATTLDGVNGTIAGNGTLAITGETTNLRGGTTAADSITIATGALTTADGTLIASGDEALQLQITDTLDNDRGTIATNGALDLTAGTVFNRDGTVQAAGSDPTRVQVTHTFDNTGGTLVAAGDTTLTAADLINVGGTVQAAGEAGLQVTVDGLLDNREDGLLAAGGDLAVSADTLDNRAGRIEHAGEGELALDVRQLDGAGGTIVSQGALNLAGETVDLGGAETVARRIAVDAGTLTTADGALVATGTEVLDLQVRNTFDNTNGQVATNGALELAADTLLNRDGTVQAAGSDPTRLQVAGTFDNTRGSVTAAGATAVQAGALVNSDGLLQSASDAAFRVTSDGQLANDGGTIAGNGDIALQAASMTNRDGLVTTQGAIDATVDGTLDNTRGALVAGGDLAVQADILLNRDTAAGGLIGDAVTLEAATLDNSDGRIIADNGLALTATDLVNAAGTIDGTGSVTLTAATFDNTAGSLVQRGSGDLTVDVSGTATNTADGLIGAEGAATLRAGTLDNRGGTVFARDGLDIASESHLLNRDGGLLQSGAGLQLDAGGTFDNQNGAVDATGAATVTAAAIVNAGGQLLAGSQGNTAAGLILTTAGDLDNRGGTVGSRGGDLDIDATAIDNRSDGTLVAGRDLTLDTAAVDNTGGTVYATRHLRYQNTAGTLTNTGGQFGAGDTAWLNLASIDNRNDGLIRAGTLWLTTPILANDGGEVAADALHAQIATMTGSGRLYGAQWLEMVFSGDFTYLDGAQFESGGRLDLTVHGTFTNQGTLQSASELNLVADNVVNHGTINASNAEGTGLTAITADGTIDNRSGASIEGDTVELLAGAVTNTGDIIGDTVAIEADTLTNGRDLGTADAARDYGEGFIGAADTLELRIGERLSNLDAELFSGGDLVIAGRTDGTRTALLENVSGRIQAEGDVYVAADTIENRRRVLEYVQRALTPEEQEAMRGVIASGTDAPSYWQTFNALEAQYCDSFGSYCSVSELRLYKEVGTPTEGLFISRASAASQLVSGGDMTLDATSLRNRHSAIAAGRNLFINGSAQSGASGETAPGVLNESLAGEQTWELTAEYEYDYQRCANGFTCHYEPSTDYGPRDLGTVTRTVTPEEGRATITAGNSLVIVSGGDVSNTVVNVSAAGGIAAGAVGGPGNTGLGTAGQASAGTVGGVGPAQGDNGLGTTAVDSVHTQGVGGTGAVSATTGPQATTAGPVQTAQGGHVGSGAAISTVTGGTTDAPAPWLIAAGEHINGPGNPANAAPQLVGTPDRPLPGLVPPDNGMFDRHADPNAPFRVTTAPRFVPDDTIGSDYLAGLLGVTTDLHKRLGDGYYEQRLVLEQILGLTGRRTLDGGDGLAQYRTLMDNAAATAAQLGLALGAPLTPVQIAALDRDIVWLVEQEIDGVTVLVPVVYLSKATAERLRSDGALMAADTVVVDSAATVRNDGTMSAGQGMWLSADTLINDGAMASENWLAVATVGDTVNRGRLAGGTVTIDAGRDVINAVQQHALGTRGGTIDAGAGGLRIDAGRDVIHQGAIASAGGVQVKAGRDVAIQAVDTVTGVQAATIDSVGNTVVNAGRDLGVDASRLSAGEHLVLDAGRDLSVTALTEVQSVGAGRTTGTRETLHASQLQAGEHLVLQAGQDVTVQAAQLDAGDAVAIAAGRDLALTTVTTTDTSVTDIRRKRFKQHTETSDQTVHGTAVQAGGDIAMTAGRDATLTAATVISEEGGIAIAAGRDLTLAAAEETHHFEQDTVKKKKGFLSSKTTTTHDEATVTDVIGTTLSGETVDMAAGRDLTATAAQVVGTGDVSLAAGRDLTIEAGQSTYSESHEKHTRKSGLMSGMGSGIGITIGSRRQGRAMESTQTVAEGSLVGSVEGNVSLVAGRDLTVAGSDVLSATGTQMIGENVTITAAEETYERSDSTYFKQSGLNVAVGGGVVDGALAAYGAAKRGSEVEDDRLSALYVAQAGYAGYDTYQGVQGMQSGTASAAGGANVRITVGSQMSESEGHLQETTHRGSTIRSGGDIAIIATGDGEGGGGDLRIEGSTVDGENVALAAANDLSITSTQDTYASTQDSRSQGGEIGVAISASQSGGAAAGLYLSANAARGEGDGHGVSHNESVITARDTLTFSSGNDTTVQGGQLSAEQVIGRVGGDLTLVSEQDTDTYDRRDRSAQGSMTIGYGFEGQASASYGRIESDYASVNEQTGIQAGAGGFDIEVGGHTELVGAAITSTADPGKNRLSADTLSATDIQNRAEYSALSVSVSTSGGQSGSGSNSNVFSSGASGAGFSGGMGLPQHEDESSTTRSGISAGTIDIRSGDDNALASIDRSVTELQQSGLETIFDERKVDERIEMGYVAGEVGMRTAGTLAQKMQRDALADLGEAKASGDQAAIDAALARVNSWNDGGTSKTLLHAAVGAAVAVLGGGDALGGALGAGGVEKAKLAMAEYLIGQGVAYGSDEYNTLMELGSVALGGALGGGSGAATALFGEQYNRQLHPDEMAWLSAHAAEFASQLYGCDPNACTADQVKAAKNRLIVEAGARVDAVMADRVGGVDGEAQAFINTHPVTFDWGEGFTATREQYYDFNYFADLLNHDRQSIHDLADALGQAGWTQRDFQNAYHDQLLALATAQRGKDGVAILENFTGDVGLALGIVRKLVQGDTEGAATDGVFAALPWGIGKTLGGVARQMASAGDNLIWLNGKTISNTWVSAKGELTWRNPLTNTIEVVPDTAKVTVDHILPQKAIRDIPGFSDLPADIRKQLLDDPVNLQPMVKPANCSKGCKVEGVDGGWMTWGDQPVSAAYKKHLEEIQEAFRDKVEKAIAAHRVASGG